MAVLGEGGGSKGGYKPPKKKVLGAPPALPDRPRKQLLVPRTEEGSKPKAAPETSGAGNWVMQKLFNTLLHSATKEKRFSESDYVKNKKTSPTPMPKARTNESFTEMANRRMPGQQLSQEEFQKLPRKKRQALQEQGRKNYAEILKRLSST